MIILVKRLIRRQMNSFTNILIPRASEGKHITQKKNWHPPVFFISIARTLMIIDRISRTCTANGTPEVHPSPRLRHGLRGARTTTKQEYISTFTNLRLILLKLVIDGRLLAPPVITLAVQVHLASAMFLIPGGCLNACLKII